MKKSRRLPSQILTFYFQNNHSFIDKSNLSEKNVTVEEKLDCIDIDDIRDLKDSLRLLFIYEECENLIVVNDDGELTGNIN